MGLFKDRTILITGGTGSLGKVLTRRLLSDPTDCPAKIIIFSRDEAKQHQMRVEYQQKVKATDEIIYRNFERLIEFQIGDVRNYVAVAAALKNAEIVIHTAALKQVPSCEYFPFEAVQTNILGAANIIRAISEAALPVQTVVGISTDKACKPVNTMGMTKALQERMLIVANLKLPATRFICVRYGNVLASRGSIIPLFHEQIKNGGPVTLTVAEMTRFLIPLEKAVDTVLTAILEARKGEIYVPKIPASRVSDIAQVLIAGQDIPIVVTGIRPGEKVHETLVSEEEAVRTFKRGAYYVIKPLLPELATAETNLQPLDHEYSSGTTVMTVAEVARFLGENRLLTDQNTGKDETKELLR
jgi:FlaA1/EpsC-like NDP-sugar epimerase